MSEELLHEKLYEEKIFISSTKSEEKKIASEKQKQQEINISYNLKQSSNSCKSTAASTSEKDFYTKRENVSEFLKVNYPKFFDNFELIQYIGKGSTGVVYEGKLKKNKKNKNLQ